MNIHNSLALLGLSSWHLASLVQATSTVYIKESDTTFALHLPKDSEHVNFYMAVPDLYQYVGVGFGGSMDNLFALIVYPNANRDGVTLSPRLSTGRTEPAFYPDAEITLNEGTRYFNQTLFVNATCTKGCRTWPGGEIEESNSAQSMSFALGPSYAAGSDDKEALLRRHQGYGWLTPVISVPGFFANIDQETLASTWSKHPAHPSSSSHPLVPARAQGCQQSTSSRKTAVIKQRPPMGSSSPSWPSFAPLLTCLLRGP